MASRKKKVVTVNGEQRWVNPLRDHADILWTRQRGFCWICGEMMVRKAMKNGNGSHDEMHATIDHLVPLSQGGSNDISNLALAHYKCNCLRGKNILQPLGKRISALELDLTKTKDELEKMISDSAVWAVKESKYKRELKLAHSMFSALRSSRDKAVNEMLRERNKTCKCWWCRLVSKLTNSH